MNGAIGFGQKTREREQGRPPFFLLGNEILDVFQPIMGPHCYTIYSHLVRRNFKNPELRHSVRDLAVATKLGATTVLRCLEILAYLGLVKLKRRGGSQESECELLDSSEAAKRLGARYAKRSLSWSLPPEMATRSHAEIDAHLLQEERRSEEGPSPTPSHDCQAQKAKTSPAEYGPDADLIWARVKFTGVMKDMGNHLLDSSRPPVPHLVNGAAEWQKFGFNSLAVEAATWR